MAGNKGNPDAFGFAPEVEDTVRLHLDANELKLIETSKQRKLEAGFNPYDTGVYRAEWFAAKHRKKKR